MTHQRVALAGSAELSDGNAARSIQANAFSEGSNGSSSVVSSSGSSYSLQASNPSLSPAPSTIHTRGMPYGYSAVPSQPPKQKSRSASKPAQVWMIAPVRQLTFGRAQAARSSSSRAKDSTGEFVLLGVSESDGGSDRREPRLVQRGGQQAHVGAACSACFS